MQTLVNLGEERQREFRRLLAISTIAHVAVALLFLAAPRPYSTPALPGVVRVDLVAALPGSQPAAPPRARPKPRPPVPEKVVLPPEPVAKPEPKPVATPEPKPAPVAPEKPPEPAPVEYEDLLAQLRERASEGSPAAEASAAGASLAGGGGGRGTLSPEVAGWMRRAKIHVTQAWVLAPGFRTEQLETEIRVRLGAGGEVLDTQVTRRSGNPWFDESVERAIRKASPLPAPPEAAEWPFLFRPQDVL